MEGITFENLAGGALQERFGDVLKEVLENIIDPNTDFKKARKINMVISFKPDEQRGYSAVEFDVKPTLAPPKKVTTGIFIDRDRNGNAVAAEMVKYVPGQTEIEDFTAKVDGNHNVISLSKEAK